MEAVDGRDGAERALSAVPQRGARRSQRTSRRAVRQLRQDAGGLRWSHGRLDGHVRLLRVVGIVCVDPKRGLRRCRRRVLYPVAGVVRIPGGDAPGGGNMALVHQTEHVVFPPVLGPDLIADVGGVATASRTTFVHLLPRVRNDERRGGGLPQHMRGLREEMDHRDSHDDDW